MAAALPTDAKERKNLPIASGVLDYFPKALAEVARVSKVGNDQHNGEGTPCTGTVQRAPTNQTH